MDKPLVAFFATWSANQLPDACSSRPFWCPCQCITAAWHGACMTVRGYSISCESVVSLCAVVKSFLSLLIALWAWTTRNSLRISVSVSKSSFTQFQSFDQCCQLGILWSPRWQGPGFYSRFHCHYCISSSPLTSIPVAAPIPRAESILGHIKVGPLIRLAGIHLLNNFNVVMNQRTISRVREKSSFIQQSRSLNNYLWVIQQDGLIFSPHSYSKPQASFLF